MYRHYSFRSIQAFVHEHAFLSYHASKHTECGLRLTGEIIPQLGYAIALPKGSPWKDPISKVILKLKEKEEIDDIYRRWISDVCIRNSTSTPMRYARLKMEYFGGLIFVLALFIIASLLLLGAEHFCHRHHRRVINPIQDAVQAWQDQKARRRNALIDAKDIAAITKRCKGGKLQINGQTPGGKNATTDSDSENDSEEDERLRQLYQHGRAVATRARPAQNGRVGGLRTQPSLNMSTQGDNSDNSDIDIDHEDPLKTLYHIRTGQVFLFGGKTQLDQTNSSGSDCSSNKSSRRPSPLQSADQSDSHEEKDSNDGLLEALVNVSVVEDINRNRVRRLGPPDITRSLQDLQSERTLNVSEEKYFIRRSSLCTSNNVEATHSFKQVLTKISSFHNIKSSQISIYSKKDEDEITRQTAISIEEKTPTQTITQALSSI